MSKKKKSSGFNFIRNNKQAPALDEKLFVSNVEPGRGPRMQTISSYNEDDFNYRFGPDLQSEDIGPTLQVPLKKEAKQKIVQKNVSNIPQRFEEGTLKIGVFGYSNIGKTGYIKSCFYPQLPTSILSFENYRLQAYEATKFYDQTLWDGIIIMYSVENLTSFDYASKLLTEIKNSTNTNAPIVLLANSISNNLRTVSKEIGEQMAKQFNCVYIETSQNSPLTELENSFYELTYIIDKNKGGTLYIDKEIPKLLQTMDMTIEQIPTVFRDSKQKTYSFLMELLAGKRNVNKQSVMVVGQENVGKTTFIKHILRNNWVGSAIDGYDSSVTSDGKLNYSYRTSITDGVDVNHWVVDDSNFTLTLFDFAGQELYYNTHQFFLSKDSVYVMMFKGNDSLNKNRIAHWLHTIITKAPAAQVFLVATHMENRIAIKNILQTNEELSKIVSSIQLVVDREKQLQIITPGMVQKNVNQQLLFWTISLQQFNCDVNQVRDLIAKLVEVSKEKVSSLVYPEHWSKFREHLFPFLTCKARFSVTENEIAEDPDLSCKLSSSKILIRNASYASMKYNGGYDGGESYDESYSSPEESDVLDFNAAPTPPLTVTPKSQVNADLILRSYPIESWDEFKKRAEEFSFHSEEDLQMFVTLLSSWGEILLIRNLAKNFFQIVLNPLWLVAVFKFFITTQRLNPSILVKFKSKLLFKGGNHDSLLDSKNSTPYIVSYSSILNKWKKQNCANSQNEDEEMTNRISSILQLLVELQLLYPLESPKDSFLIPSLLSDKSAPSSLQKYIKKINEIPKKPPKVQSNEIEIERIYDLKFLPSGLFTRLMLCIWAWRKLNINNIWGKGFVVGEFDPRISTAVIRYDQPNHSSATSIYVNIVCHKQFAGELLPYIHQSLIHIFQVYDVERSVNIFCRFPKLPPLTTYLLYDKCLASVISNTNEYNLDTTTLSLLIPELFRALSIRASDISNSADREEEERYQREVKELKLLASGATGEVWKGLWYSQLVAIKKIHQLDDAYEISSLMNEIALLRSLKHPNVLRLYDVYRKPFSIITELCDCGDLSGVINSSDPLPPIIAVQIVKDIASALSYLHSQSPPIIHCDVRLPNIFIKSLSIDSNITAVLGDVGFSRIADTNLSSGNLSTLDDISKFSEIISFIVQKLNRDLEAYLMDFPEIFSLLSSFSLSVEKLHDVDYINSFLNHQSSSIENDLSNSDLHPHLDRIANIVNSAPSVDSDIAYTSSDEEVNNYFDYLDESEIMKIENSTSTLNLDSKHTTLVKKAKLDFLVIRYLSTLQLKLADVASKTFCFYSLAEDAISLDEFQHILKSYIQHVVESFTNSLHSEKVLHFNTKTTLITKLSYLNHKSNLHSPSSIDHLITLLQQLRSEIKGVGYFWSSLCSLSYPILRYAIKEQYLTEKHLSLLHSLEFVDVGSPHGHRLTHLASKYSQTGLLHHIFLKFDTDPNALTLTHKKSSLHYAAKSDNSSLIHSHYKFGANLNITDYKGRVPLLLAAQSGCFNSLLALLNLKADPNLVDSSNSTPILSAALSQSPNSRKCIKALLQFGSMNITTRSSGDSSIPSDTLKIIKQEAELLLSNTSSSYARTNFTSSRTLRSWLK